MIIPQISSTNANIKPHYYSPRKRAGSAEISYEQNGFSFAQAEALKSPLILNKLAFRGKIIAPSFDVKDVGIVQKLLAKCHYGKKDLIYGDISQVKTKITDEGVCIENFYTPDDSPDGKIYGICEELAYKVGRRLQKMFGDKYLVFAIQGRNRQFSKGWHTYLGIIHNTPENQSLIGRQVENFAQYNRACKEFKATEVYKSFPKDPDEGAKLHGTPLYEKYFNTAEAFRKKIAGLTSRFSRRNVANALIIDPSFARIEEFGTGKVFNGYTCNTIRSLEQINSVSSSPGQLLPRGYVPIGYLRDLVPEIVNNKGSMVYIFLHDKGIAPFGCKELVDFFVKRDKTHPLYKFMVKLNEAFKKSE